MSQYIRESASVSARVECRRESDLATTDPFGVSPSPSTAVIVQWLTTIEKDDSPLGSVLLGPMFSADALFFHDDAGKKRRKHSSRKATIIRSMRVPAAYPRVLRRLGWLFDVVPSDSYLLKACDTSQLKLTGTAQLTTPIHLHKRLPIDAPLLTTAHALQKMSGAGADAAASDPDYKALILALRIRALVAYASNVSEVGATAAVASTIAEVLASEAADEMDGATSAKQCCQGAITLLNLLLADTYVSPLRPFDVRTSARLLQSWIAATATYVAYETDDAIAEAMTMTGFAAHCEVLSDEDEEPASEWETTQEEVASAVRELAWSVRASAESQGDRLDTVAGRRVRAARAAVETAEAAAAAADLKQASKKEAKQGGCKPEEQSNKKKSGSESWPKDEFSASSTSERAPAVKRANSGKKAGFYAEPSVPAKTKSVRREKRREDKSGGGGGGGEKEKSGGGK